MRRFKPLDLVDKVLFQRWVFLTLEALEAPGPFNVPSWPDYRKQHQ